mmetsp:Transcript_5600/g.13184  ORF Transcript_5600/g.13184 Transcript_5600/m.13184 type:complete len:141 (-) Transcript_5600:246-668(-)
MTAVTRFPSIYPLAGSYYSPTDSVYWCSLPTTKPKQRMNKPKLETTTIRSKKVSVLSEKISFRAIDEISQSRNDPSLDTWFTSISSIFVKKTFNEDYDHNDNWTLKRASPVYDSDDDDNDDWKLKRAYPVSDDDDGDEVR